VISSFQKKSETDEILVAVVVSLLLVVFSALFGTHDIEESTNTAYSAEAISRGTQSIWGIPVFDSLQATGNRLPYQGSWSQSITWPIHLSVSWQFLQLARTLVFSTAAMWLFVRVLKSWIPRISGWRLFVFGLLMSSSFGLYVRQNDWSDQFAQTISTLGVALFFMHRRFNDSSSSGSMHNSRVEPILLFVCVNGVVTGHPGMWMIGLFTWAILLALLMTRRDFRGQFGAWLRHNVVSSALIVGSSLVTGAVVMADLLEEKSAQRLAASSSQMWQGFIGDQLLRGATNGVLPDFVERMVSLALTSISLPILHLIAGLWPATPSSLLNELLMRASGSFPRGEFAGSLAILAFVLARRRIQTQASRGLLTRLVGLQMLIWVFVVLCSIDVVPVALAPSALFTIAPVLLGVNVFMLFLLHSTTTSLSRTTRGVVMLSYALVALWLIIQLGFGVARPSFPERHETWFAQSKELQRDTTLKEFFDTSDRLIIADARSADTDELPKWESFIGFVGLGLPVVAPANPKIRDTTQLVSNIAFRNTLDVWSGLKAWPMEQIDQVLDFLQIRYVAVELTDANSNLLEHLEASSAPFATSRGGSTTLDVKIGEYRFRVVKRTTFAAEVRIGNGVTLEGNCAILEQRCPVLTDATRRVSSSSPSLSLCASRQCIWEFNSLTINRDEQLVLPVTYDNVLDVHDASGTPLETSNMGGFLAVSRTNGIGESELRVTLDPDIRMLLRVFVSYLNLGVLLVLLGAALQPWVQSRRRRLRIE